VLQCADMDDVITQIEHHMAAQGMTRAELSRRVKHRYPSAITRLLNRQHEPGAELLQAIATALGQELVIPARPAVVLKPARIDA
jgi:transcriptional regulator with XRE-family HTH domain